MCETTLATNVIDFNDLYKGPVFDMSLADTDECSKECYDINNLDACGAECKYAYVRDINNLDACGAECKYAYVRDIIQIIKNWPKIKHKSPEFA
jgi:hypothetical protein